jgi:16S rRNA (guanine966-N2)-methyltransferase
MRIVAGAWRGRTLVASPGQGTRPTADRVRQALFDILMHAEWGGREAVEGAAVLDVFAGTGALGLEALSRGAATACFIESDAAALKALRANVAACKAEDRTRVLAVDVLRTPSAIGATASLVFLDPPYGSGLVPRAVTHLLRTGHIAPGALIIAEIGQDETWIADRPPLAERQHGAARVVFFRLSEDCKQRDTRHRRSAT